MKKEAYPRAGRTKTCVHRWAAILFFCAFAAIGARGIIQRRGIAPVIDNTGPACCTDAMLKLSFGVSGGTQIIAGHIARIPPRLPLVIFFPADDPVASLASEEVGSVAWPRDVILVPSNSGELPQMVGRILKQPAGSGEKLAVGGVMFCRIEPPASLPGLQMLMPRLYLMQGNTK